MSEIILCPRYLEWIKRFPCLVCNALPVDPDHLQARGFGSAKQVDFFAVPLCRTHHTNRHDWGNRKFEDTYAVDLWREAARFEALFLQKLFVEHEQLAQANDALKRTLEYVNGRLKVMEARATRIQNDAELLAEKAKTIRDIVATLRTENDRLRAELAECLAALADIAVSEDMTETQRRAKAKRVYDTVRVSEENQQ